MNRTTRRYLRPFTFALALCLGLYSLTSAQMRIDGGGTVPATITGSKTFTGTVAFADGTAAAPSITFASQTGTGWFYGGDGKVGLGLGSGTTPMILLGGTTSAFPAFKRNGAALDVRVADDSTYASINSNTISVAASGFIGFIGRSFFASASDGVFSLINNAGTDFGRLQFGGTTTSFPAHVRDGIHIIERRADNTNGTLAVANVGAASCGTTAATITGTDKAFRVTVGATSGTECRVTFVGAWTVAPACIVNNETTANLARTDTPTTTTIDLAGTFVGGDVLSVLCNGY